MQQKEWTIVDNMIQPMEMRPPSFLCINMIQAIERLGFEDIYMRGSVTEEVIPHPKSDVDIIAFVERNPYRNLRTEILEALRPFNRPCDVLVTSREAYMQNRALSLLGCTRSLTVSIKYIAAACTCRYGTCKGTVGTVQTQSLQRWLPSNSAHHSQTTVSICGRIDSSKIIAYRDSLHLSAMGTRNRTVSCR